MIGQDGWKGLPFPPLLPFLPWPRYHSGHMTRLASRFALGVVCVALAGMSTHVSTAGPGATDWPSTNYDQTANRYSPLKQITKDNVAALQQVWSIHLKPAGFTGPMRE